METLLQRLPAAAVEILRTAGKIGDKKGLEVYAVGGFVRDAIMKRACKDVDLMVIGSCSFGRLVEALAPVQDKLGREVNPSVYPVSEFRRKIAAKHHFLSTVVREPKIFLIGDEHELEGIVG